MRYTCDYVESALSDFYDSFDGKVRHPEELEVELEVEAERYYQLGEELKFKASRTYHRPEYDAPVRSKCSRCGAELSNDATTGDRLSGPACISCGQSIKIPKPKGKKLSKEELQDLLDEIKKQEPTFKLD